MSENLAFNRLKTNIIRPGECIDRIENRNMSVSGMFDVNMTLKGAGDIWVELKEPKLIPSRKDTPFLNYYKNHSFTKQQAAWGINRYYAGSKVFVFIKAPGCYILIGNYSPTYTGYKDLFLKINMMPLWELKKVSLVYANTPVDAYKWKEFRNALVNL